MCTPIPAAELSAGSSLPPAGEPVSLAGGGSGPDMTPSQIWATYRTEIEAASDETGVPEEIIVGMIWQESKGNKNVPGGGLMQIGAHEFEQFGGGAIGNPRDNIMAGARYMSDMHRDFGSWELALRAYNSGPNGVDRNNPAGTPAGTGDPTYVDKVLRAAGEVGFNG